MAVEEKSAWVKRVLGAEIGGRTAASPGTRRQRVLPIWASAKEAVDGQLAALQKALRDYGEPVGLDVAERGLPGWTNNTLVPMTAALMQLDMGGDVPSPGHVKTALSRVAAFRQKALADPVIETLENNPYGVKVAIRSTLTGALDRIEAALEG
jgi:hypothetical protein